MSCQLRVSRANGVRLGAILQTISFFTYTILMITEQPLLDSEFDIEGVVNSKFLQVAVVYLCDSCYPHQENCVKVWIFPLMFQ